mmetsp:Transcript_28381/g.87812  ORF Transcript_28381/g.87812 Transcript_28381/m.87812 type:complete len:97 (-) Transcript_28381:821-1111(-)
MAQNILRENIHELEKVVGRHKDLCLRFARIRQASHGPRSALVQEGGIERLVKMCSTGYLDTMSKKQKESILRHLQVIQSIEMPIIGVYSAYIVSIR